MSGMDKKIETYLISGELISGHMDRLDGWIDRWAGRQMDGWVGRYVDGQIHKYISRYINKIYKSSEDRKM